MWLPLRCLKEKEKTVRITATAGGKRITIKIIRKEKIMSMMTFVTLAMISFVGASSLALIMDKMVEGKK